MSRAASCGSGTWLDHLPYVLLGMRTSIREDSLCSPADLLYGAPLRLPGDLLDPLPLPPSASDFACQLQAVMGSSSLMPALHHSSPASKIHPSLRSASHVFLRVDAVRRPLVPPYLGPFQVLHHGDKTFKILQNNKTVTVSIDRLKPAYFLPDAATLPVTPPRSRTAVPSSSPRPPATVPVSVPPVSQFPDGGRSVSASPSAPALDPDLWPLPTRYGRRPRPPSRLNL